MSVATYPTHDEVTAALTIPRFRAWLESKAPGSIVGDREDCATCPLAMFLQEALGCPEVAVYYGSVHWGAPNDYADRPKWVGVPGWVSMFISRIDRGHAVRVTAGRCIRVLADVEKAL